MSRDPSTGRFLSEDPLRFAAGDTNLYRYVGNNAPNATDPLGQEIQYPKPGGNYGGSQVQQHFFADLARQYPNAELRPQLTTMLASLARDPDFQKMWKYLESEKPRISFSLAAGLRPQNDQPRVPGAFLRPPGPRPGLGVADLRIDPTFPIHLENPAELIDSLVHEVVHAVLYIQKETKDPTPLLTGILDNYTDLAITGPLGDNNNLAGGPLAGYPPALQQYLLGHYGNVPTVLPGNPTDINLAGQVLIAQIVGNVIGQTGLSPTATFSNIQNVVLYNLGLSPWWF